ncbi:MAG: hypothetical protein GY861_06185 [bacterium]|nr:hypothetical protein [bacterium]
MKNDSNLDSDSIANAPGEINPEKLLIPGYAGYMDNSLVEKTKKALQNDPRLRSTWGFTKGNRRLSKKKIRLVAEYGIEAHRNGSSF